MHSKCGAVPDNDDFHILSWNNKVEEKYKQQEIIVIFYKIPEVIPVSTSSTEGARTRAYTGILEY